MSKRKDINKLEARVDNLQGTVTKLQDKVNLLEEVLVKAGIIEDLDMTDVLYRTVPNDDPWSLLYGSNKRIPFVVNEAKVK